ncbi:MAG: CobW family GTP-binding protein [Pseudomonadota bacterium]
MIVDVIFGFLGSGKTTFITRILREWDSDEKIVVLVNEFGDVGIDGELLSSQGGNVVEMPSGCICCTLQADFRAQILEISRTIQPDRIIIEPTGVATIGQIQWILEAQLFEREITQIHKILIADATGFMGLYRANRHFVESQVENAHIIMLNKCDRVDQRKAKVIQSAISAINPELTVFMTEFGGINWNEYHAALFVASESKTKSDTATYLDSRRKERIQQQGKTGTGPVPARPAVGIFGRPEEAGLQPHFHEEADALGYESFGLLFADSGFDLPSLNNLFLQMTISRSVYGEIIRAKGIFRTGSGWKILELASGDVSIQPIRPFQESKVSIIGKFLNREMIGTAFQQCRSEEQV